MDGYDAPQPTDTQDNPLIYLFYHSSFFESSPVNDHTINLIHGALITSSFYPRDRVLYFVGPQCRKTA